MAHTLHNIHYTWWTLRVVSRKRSFVCCLTLDRSDVTDIFGNNWNNDTKWYTPGTGTNWFMHDTTGNISNILTNWSIHWLYQCRKKGNQNEISNFFSNVILFEFSRVWNNISLLWKIFIRQMLAPWQLCSWQKWFEVFGAFTVIVKKLMFHFNF